MRLNLTRNPNIVRAKTNPTTLSIDMPMNLSTTYFLIANVTLFGMAFVTSSTEAINASFKATSIMTFSS